MAVKDMLTDFDTFDILIKDGDFVVNDSDSHSIQYIFKADKGQFRQFPFVGLGASKYHDSSVDPQIIKQAAKLQLKIDNFRVKRIDTDGNLEIFVDAIRIK